MRIANKDIVIGALTIGIVSLAGLVGFLIYTWPEETVKIKTKTETDEETEYIYIEPTEPELLYGLPDDWSNAPNDSKIILYNETGDSIEITLKQILDYVNKFYETDTPEQEYWWEKRLEPRTVIDPSGIPVTGVDILELLRVFDCNFAGEIEFVSNNDTATILSMDVVEMCNTLDEHLDIILGIAANKTWLKQSPIGYRCGDFSIFGQDSITGKEIEFTCYDLESMRVTKNWTITVNVYNNDGTPNQTLVLDYLNLTSSYTGPYTYEYENTDWYNFNRTYYGTNVSQIVDYTNAKGIEYRLNFTFYPGDMQPSSKGKRKVYSSVHYFNWTDVEQYLSNNGTHIVGNHIDQVNGSQHMLKTNLRMCIVHNVQYHTEYDSDGNVANAPWDEFYNIGYAPFMVIIPGCTKPRFFNGLVEINITIISQTPH